MDKKKKMNEEVKKTLNSIEGIKKEEISPFFYTRAQARLDEYKSGQAKVKPSGFMPGFRLGYAFAVVLLVLNLVTGYSYLTESSDSINEEGSEDKTEMTREDYIKSLAEEYSIGTNDYNY